LEKAPDAFRTISEVADDLDIPQHVLRFWESRFQQIKPMKRGGGRRYYRPEDIDLLRGIRHLLYGEGYTIRGVQRILKEHGVKFVQGVWQAGAEQPRPETSDMTPDQSELSDVESDAEAQADGAQRRAPEVPELIRSAITKAARGATEGERASDAKSGPSPENLRKLQGVLSELTECRRLLDAALEEKA
jgi:DNA-binding transcriptional MerR regulator